MRPRLPEPPRSTIAVDLLTLTPPDRELFWAGYASGVVEGITMGRNQAEDEAEVAWRTMADRVRRTATTSVPYSVLCERRGDPERAERARERERRLGGLR